MIELLPILVIVILIFCVIRVSSENQRFALYNIGHFVGFKGPGLVLKWPWGAITWVKLTIGDRGELISDALGKFNDIELPLMPEGSISIGSRIRIKDFSEKHLIVIKDPDQTRVVTCDKCGNKIKI